MPDFYSFCTGSLLLERHIDEMELDQPFDLAPAVVGPIGWDAPVGGERKGLEEALAYIRPGNYPHAKF